MDAGWADRVRKAVGGLPSSPGLVTFLHYEVQARIGEGATAEVYRAVDRKLNRPVALKFLRGEMEAHPQTRKRFLREAQAAARVVHPNVVGVHEVGEAEGRLYLAMELVEGRTLSDVLEKEKTGLRVRVALLEKAAQGVAAAHGAGIVHRDLKPGNILVTAGGVPKVADFGLAQLAGDQTKLTRTGAAVGTPLYMAPEQVAGRAESIGPRTDVYALGAILYEMLTGRPPHLGTNVTEVYAKVLGSDPEAPRKTNPGAPAELEAVCLKALDKEPNRRYPTAGEFSEELGRWMRGEPVAAKRTSRAYRLYRRVKRNPVVAGLGGACAVAALAAGVFWWLQAQSQVQLEREKREALEMMRSTARVSLEAALQLRRAGLNGGMRKFLPELEEAYRRAVRRAPDLAEVDYRMGRMHRVLMEDDKALEYQERALQKEPHHAPALYERVVLLGRLYRRRLGELAEIALRDEGERRVREGAGEIKPGAPPSPSRWEELAKRDDRARTLAARLEADLSVMQQGLRGMADGEVDCALGLKAWHEGSWDEARRLLTAAVVKRPQLEEAYEALATLESTEGRYEESVRWWTAGLGQDAGYIPHLQGRGLARRMAGEVKLSRGEDDPALYESAIADFDAALGLDRDRVDSWLGRGMARANRGYHMRRRGEDGRPFFEAGIQDLSEALRLSPGRDEILAARGLAYMNLGAYRTVVREDPTAPYRSAIDDFDKALRLNPGRDLTWQWRGSTKVNWAKYKGSRGEDPQPLFEEAIKDFGEALRRDPSCRRTWEARGVARMHWGNARAGRGTDPVPLYQAALEDFGEALRLGSDADELRLKRAQLSVNWGLYAADRREDPSGLYDAAIRDLTQALQNNRSNPETWNLLSIAYLARAQRRASRGEKAGADYRATLEACTEAVRLDPSLEPRLRDSVKMARSYLAAHPGE